MKDLFDKILSRLELWQKFLILAVLTTLLVLIPFSLYVASALDDVTVAQNGQKGIKPIEALQNLMKLTQQHRGMSSLVLNGQTSVAAAREAKEKEVVVGLTAFDDIVQKKLRNKAITDDWSKAKQNLQTLLAQVNDTKINAEQSVVAHTDIINQYFGISDKIADLFELSLDPEAASYHTMYASLYTMPRLAETLGRSRALGATLLAKKQADANQRAALTGFSTLSLDNKTQALNELQKVFLSDIKIKADLAPDAQKLSSLADTAIKLTDNEIVKKDALSYDSTAYFNTYTAAIDAVFELNKKSLTKLQSLLKARENKLLTQMVLIGISVLLLSLLGFFVGYLITGSITRPVRHLVGVMQRLAGGDNTVRANMKTFDEIGLMGRQFDAMVDQREKMTAQIQKENDTLNNSIIDMLQAVAGIAQRDLTLKAPVAEDITGPLGDAVNYLADETAKVLNKVVQIAGEVSTISGQVKSQSDMVIGIAEQEKIEVDKSTAELGVASEEMFNIAKLALTCNEAAAKAIQNTDKAQATVLGTVQGITSIRDTIRETEKRIKRLGERSQEIGSVVTIINGIAERTHILALNASMHAASAGEAGRGFAVVASEVQKLAENAREATQQIAGLVNNIQVETADTVTNMNDAITQVVQGTSLAQQAGNEMLATRETTAELVQLVQRIADNSKTQAETAQKIRERSESIQRSTEETFKQLKSQGIQTDRLVVFSGNLVQSVGVFTLPKAAEAMQTEVA